MAAQQSVAAGQSHLRTGLPPGNRADSSAMAGSLAGMRRRRPGPSAQACAGSSGLIGLDYLREAGDRGRTAAPGLGPRMDEMSTFPVAGLELLQKSSYGDRNRYQNDDYT